MGKKVRVALHGFQKRGIMVDASATEGATVGKNLRWLDGTLVTEAELRGITGQNVSNGTTIDENLLNYILANLGQGSAAATAWPLHKDRIESSETLTIPENYEYMINETFTVEGTLTVETGGEMIIFDRGLADLNGPDFTYDVSDNLTQIDYDDGSQKIFTYNGGGDLTRVDLIRDGVTFRKDFVYSGDTLDYVDEYYV